MRRTPLFTHRRRVLPVIPSPRGLLESSCCIGTTPIWREDRIDSAGKTTTRIRQKTRNKKADASLAKILVVVFCCRLKKTLLAVGQREQSRSRAVVSSQGEGDVARRSQWRA